MKKTLSIIAMASLIIAASCNRKDDSLKNVLEAEVSVSSKLDELKYAEPIEFEAKVTTKQTLTEAKLIAVSGKGDSMQEVGEAQVIEISGTSISGKYFIDAKNMTAIKLILRAGDKVKEQTFPVGKVSGDMLNDIYCNDAMVLTADKKVATHENSPETYPAENTGAASDTKSFFSMHGVKINGKTEHILSLDDARSVDGKNLSLCWLNCLENTAKGKVTFIGSQRGYMFSGCRKSSLGGGTTGRQCDIYSVDGHAITDKNIDYNFGMKVVNGSWKGESYKEELYKYIDALFTKIADKPETNLEKIKANWYLSDIQRTLDNATLGNADNPTSLTKNTFLRRWADAGHSGSKSAVENFRAGDYVVISSKLGTAESPQYYYGLIQILQLPDDSGTFVTDPNTGRNYIDQTKAYELFMKPAYFAVKTQCALSE